MDDVLDVTQTSEQLGKTAGKDTAHDKATYPALFGIEASLKKADELVSQADLPGPVRRARGNFARDRKVPGRAKKMSQTGSPS